jgi:hypothetical protein
MEGQKMDKSKMSEPTRIKYGGKLMTSRQACLIIEAHEIDAIIEESGDDLKENNPDLLDAYLALQLMTVGGEKMTTQQKSEEILKAICEIVAREEGRLTIESDFADYGAATLIDQDGAHTHVGCRWTEAELATHEGKQIAFDNFVRDLHGQLVCGRGLSWCRPESQQVRNADEK